MGLAMASAASVVQHRRFTVQDVEGNGDCLFLALAYAEAGSATLSTQEVRDRAAELRRLANDWLCPGGPNCAASVGTAS